MRIKTIRCGVLILSITVVFSGCWDYRGLDEMALVAGVAIDMNDRTGVYIVTFEVIDLTLPIEAQGIKSFILESEGKTIFDAARNAKMKIQNKLYFGDTLLVIVSRMVAEQVGIFPIVEWFLRDNETREVVNLVVSQKQTAKEIFKYKLGESSIVSYEINEIVKEDNKITSSTHKSEIYDLFNILGSEGISLTVPAISSVMNDGKEIAVINGVMIFKEDKVIGELTPKETKYYLFADDKVEGGLITLPLTDGKDTDDITLEIVKNKTKRSCSFDEGKMKIEIETETDVYIGEYQGRADMIDPQVYTELEEKAEGELKQEITSVIKKAQTEYQSDIFGFGNTVYKKDNKLWKQIDEKWDELFKNADIEVKCKVQVNSSAHIKNTVKE